MSLQVYWIWVSVDVVVVMMMEVNISVSEYQTSLTFMTLTSFFLFWVMKESEGKVWININRPTTWLDEDEGRKFNHLPSFPSNRDTFHVENVNFIHFNILLYFHHTEILWILPGKDSKVHWQCVQGLQGEFQ